MDCWFDWSYVTQCVWSPEGPQPTPANQTMDWCLCSAQGIIALAAEPGDSAGTADPHVHLHSNNTGVFKADCYCLLLSTHLTHI